MSQGLFRHLRNYASAGVLSMMVGIATFPIMTRNLSVEDYGILGLIMSSLTLFVAIGKLGVQHSLLRFFAAARQGNGLWNVREMHATVASVFLGCALATTGLWLITGYAVLPRYLQYENIGSLFLAASGVVFIRLLGSGIINFLRAEQRSGDVARAQMISRLVTLLLVVALALLGDLDVRTMLVSVIVAEVLAMTFAASRYRESFAFNWREVRAPLVHALLAYGLPLMMLESLGLLLKLSDRYLIEAMLGVEALGQYAASSNLVRYLDVIVLSAMVQAIRPVYMQIFESNGEAGTRSFLSRGLNTYIMLGLPFVALFSLVAPHMLSVLAGERYAPGSVVIPFITFSVLIEGTVHFLAAGLYLNKNTRVLMRWSAVAVVANLLLNVLLIPRFGLIGAASVTIFSYALFLAGVSIAAFRELAFPVRWRAPLLMGIVSLSLWWGVDHIAFDSDLASAFAKGMVAAPPLLALLFWLDPGCRDWLLARIARSPLRRAGNGAAP